MISTTNAAQIFQLRNYQVTGKIPKVFNHMFMYSSHRWLTEIAIMTYAANEKIQFIITRKQEEKS